MLMRKFDYLIGIIAILAFLLLIAEFSSYFIQYAHIIKITNLVILLLFICDVFLRFFISKDKKKYLRYNWFDLIVFIPLIQFIRGIEHTPFFVIVWQIVIVMMLLSRVKRANKFITLLSLRPAQLMVTSFSFAIGIGTILLMLPVATKTGVKTSLADALFTATSATCVTGLIVKDTAGYFSIFGQMVILFLIQIGGLGIMTFSVSLALLLRKRIEVQRQIVMQDVLDQDTLSSVKDFIKFIIKMTIAFELIGAFILFIVWKDKFSDIPLAGYHAFFHSISAFCNAGFSTFSDSLMGFSRDASTNIIICLLIILGGLGFTVIKDLYEAAKSKLAKNSRKVINLRVQTKVVLVTSFLLIVGGALAFYAIENNNTFSSLGTKEKVLSSLFQSITARTAGFNTCDFSKLSSATLLLMILLMFIGGSPGSTAGGIKTTTVSILWAMLISGFKRKENVELCKRTIPYDVIQKAISVFVASFTIVTIFALLLLYIEKKVFHDILFETMSAFGTVGLSTGATSQLSGKGKVIITLLMFIGRLGPLTIGYAFTRFGKPARYIYAEERPMVG